MKGVPVITNFKRSIYQTWRRFVVVKIRFSKIREMRFSLTFVFLGFRVVKKCAMNLFFFLYLGFLLRTFTNHRTAEEGGGYFFNSSLQLHPLHRHLDISRDWEPLVSERKPLTTKLRALS